MIGLWTLAIAQRVKLGVLASLIVPYPTRGGGRQTRRRQLFCAAAVRVAHQGAGPPAGAVAVSRRFTQLAAMSESNSGPPRVRPRQSLSGRLWLVATLAVLLSEIMVFLPYIAHERSSWLIARLEDAAIAVIAAANGTMDTARHDELLHLADTEAIRVTDSDGRRDDRQCRDAAGCHDRSSTGESARPRPSCAPRHRAAGEPPDPCVGQQPLPSAVHDRDVGA